ncbi:MAG: AAA family ATPase [Candidatus Coproplasma sp.]
MSFADRFREKYRVALYAARANNQEATLAGLADLYKLFAEQYSLNNGDSIVVKAKLSYWQDVFGGYMDIIRKYGLGDRRVQKFFGLIDDADVPSFGDYLGGNTQPVTPINGGEKVTPPVGGIDISGIVEPEKSKTNPPVDQPVVVQPVEPVEVTQPVEPVEPVVEVVDEEPEVPQLPEDKTGEDKASFDPDTLEGFIGQAHIVKAMLKEIAIAKAQGRKYLDNILLFGNPGLGKTTLASLIAKALGVRFEWMDCSQYRNSQQSLKALQSFLLKVARENEPVVIFFDEIHMLTDELQSSLLTLLNNRVYVSPPDVNGVVKHIPIENFTFIAATTDDDKVLNTIKDRCLRLKFQMVDYTPEELKLIYKRKVASMGLTISDEAIDACIPRSRGSIRYVNAFVKGLETALYNDEGVLVSKDIDLGVVERFFEEKGVDAIGLEKKDLEILNVIAEDASGAIGVETLSARIGLDPKKYMSEYEPYLIKIGFVTVTGRGRGLTEKAIKYLQKGENS